MPTTIPQDLRVWLSNHINLTPYTVEPIVPEASTRLFWRLRSTNSSLIVMLSPPATENNQQFCKLSELFRDVQVPVPTVLAQELNQGYLLVSDVGQKELKSVYQTCRQDDALATVLDVLTRIQQVNSTTLPLYTQERLHMELGIFAEWFCQRLMCIDSSPLKEIQNQLVDSIDAQPKLPVHRDFHCKNLLYSADGQLGVVDFQDALLGPCFYDLASLLYDCYHQFTPTSINQYLLLYLKQAEALKIISNPSLDDVTQALEYCAIQRQLKAVGIFCRLVYQQQKTSHLSYILPVLERVAHLAANHAELATLGHWLHKVIPSATQRLRTLATSDHNT